MPRHPHYSHGHGHHVTHLTRLRLGFSQLNYHLFQHHCISSPECKCRRPRGRPHLRYKDVCRSTLKDFSIQEKTWEQLAVDRNRWRAAVTTLWDWRTQVKYRAGVPKSSTGRAYPSQVPGGRTQVKYRAGVPKSSTGRAYPSQVPGGRTQVKYRAGVPKSSTGRAYPSQVPGGRTQVKYRAGVPKSSTGRAYPSQVPGGRTQVKYRAGVPTYRTPDPRTGLPTHVPDSRPTYRTTDPPTYVPNSRNSCHVFPTPRATYLPKFMSRLPYPKSYLPTEIHVTSSLPQELSTKQNSCHVFPTPRAIYQAKFMSRLPYPKSYLPSKIHDPSMSRSRDIKTGSSAAVPRKAARGPKI
ncbi:hypothetical protein Bbelb_205290 [Branchiostoma belcheri]|nr:hypothetical protein Bbelb_205290 [Branchiostoma belcheri]